MESQPEGPTGTETRDTALVLLGGDAPAVAPETLLDAAQFVIAADSGLDHAEKLGIAVDLVVGDLDSVSPAALERAEAAAVRIERHPADKDATDFELAVSAAIDHGFSRIIVAGGRGGRLSHLLGNATLLASPRLQLTAIEWWLGDTVVTAADARRTAVVRGAVGDRVSLVPIGKVTGITTTGLHWQLDNATLDVGTTRGISNTMDAGEATISVTQGALLVVAEKARP